MALLGSRRVLNAVAEMLLPKVYVMVTAALRFEKDAVHDALAPSAVGSVVNRPLHTVLMVSVGLRGADRQVKDRVMAAPLRVEDGGGVAQLQ